jgi:sulfur-carrier protein
MTVDIPAILRAAIGVHSIEIAATTVRGALAELRAHPRLGPLIFDESATLRPHVLLFVNETDSRHLPSLDVLLKPDDRVAIVQAVSGG